MIAVVPARGGEPALDFEEVIAACGGRALVAGEGAAEAARLVTGRGIVRERVLFAELGPFAPGSWAQRLAALLVAGAAADDGGTIVLPASPDGRDLAPRLAFVLRRPYVGAALEVCERSATVVRRGGHQNVRVSVDGAFVATLLRSGGPPRRSRAGGRAEPPRSPAIDGPEECPAPGAGADAFDAVQLGVLESEPSEVDLREAERVFAGGGGLRADRDFALLSRVGSILKAAVGGTRVVTDAGLLPPDRQIGTTGAYIRPRCYVAFGISGAAQHLGGVAAEKVIAANLDPSCPMMSVADLALVTDAPALLEALEARIAHRTEGLGE